MNIQLTTVSSSEKYCPLFSFSEVTLKLNLCSVGGCLTCLETHSPAEKDIIITRGYELDTSLNGGNDGSGDGVIMSTGDFHIYPQILQSYKLL